MIFFSYAHMLVVPTRRLQEAGPFPLEPSIFEEKVDALCAECRDVLLKEWLPKCADIFLELKPFWEQFIPKLEGDTLTIIESFFDCVNGLMSSQIRRLVMQSLRHFLKFLATHQVN